MFYFIGTTCLPSPPSTGNGQAICSDGAFVDSVCRFDCEEGYRLSGSRTLTCSESGQWNSAAPKCLRMLRSLLLNFRTTLSICSKNFVFLIFATALVSIYFNNCQNDFEQDAVFLRVQAFTFHFFGTPLVYL